MTAELVAAGVFDPAIGDVRLVLSELISNAIRHAEPLPGSLLQVSWALLASDESVEVAVSDGGGQTRPWPAQESLSALGGRGLVIVQHLCRDWGVRDDTRGLTVWAVLPAPPAMNGGSEPSR
jgi:anti-sigma regulatory factor (Ser/Thr protein kinase)